MKANFVVSVVVPVYNNADILRDTIARLNVFFSREFAGYELIFVDDASSDDSWSILESAAAENKKIRLMRHEINQGQQMALTTGGFAAQGEIFISVDCDLPCTLADLKKLAIVAAQGTELVLGRRIGGKPRVWWRHVGSFFVGLMTRVLYSYEIRDFGCSTGAARREVIDRLRGKTPRAIKIQLIEEAKSFVEVDMDVSQVTIREKSGYSFFSLLRVMWAIIWYKIARR